MKSRREGRDTRHREKFVDIRKSISYPFMVMDFDFEVKANKIGVPAKLQKNIIAMKSRNSFYIGG